MITTGTRTQRPQPAPDGAADGRSTPDGPAVPPPPMVDIRDLSVHFPARRGRTLKAVDGIDLTIRRGMTLGLVGESGSGKSTLGQTILRLTEPTSGSIHFDGTDITRLGRSALKPFRRRMQVVFQDPYAALNPRQTIGQVLTEPLLVHDWKDRGARAARTAELLATVGLPPEAADRYPHQFSGGQRQRIGIARALALSPDFLVADEPVSALDVSIQAQILALLGTLRDRLSLTMLFISHDLAVVRHLCDEVAVMYLGRIVERAPVADLYRTPRHPYTQALLSAIPRRRPGARTIRTVLQGDLPSPLAPPSGCTFRTRCPNAREICSAVRPALLADTNGHARACHFDLP